MRCCFIHSVPHILIAFHCAAEISIYLMSCLAWCIGVGRSTDEHIDKTIVKDLVSDEDALLAKQEAKAEKKQRKADQKVRERLKAERKKAANSKDVADDDEDGENIANFAKASRKTKTR